MMGTGRGRMISIPNRVKAVELIDEAVHSGARRVKACEEPGISDRTYRRWTSGSGVRKDGRPEAQYARMAGQRLSMKHQQIS